MNPIDDSPFGSPATSAFLGGPWLCAPASRRVCLFVDVLANIHSILAGRICQVAISRGSRKEKIRENAARYYGRVCGGSKRSEASIRTPVLKNGRLADTRAVPVRYKMIRAVPPSERWFESPFATLLG